EKSLSGLSCRIIAKHLGVSKSSVSRIIQYFQEFCCVEKVPCFRKTAIVGYR
ncbi:9456_t:CDS:1, partial [Funneliformis caledonium]